MNDKQKTNVINEEFLERLTRFKEKLQFDLEATISKNLDEYTKEHFGEDMPVEEFIALINASSVATSNITVKNLSLAAAYYNDVNVGLDHIKAVQKDYESAIEHLDQMREQLVDFLTNNTKAVKNHSVH